jgi:hypothetical protein
MRETFTTGSVGRAPGNRCLYPEADALRRPLRSRFQARLSASVRGAADKAAYLMGCKSPYRQLPDSDG